MINCLRRINISAGLRVLHPGFYLIAGLFCYLGVQAQADRQPHFRNYTTDDGLPSHEVHDIIQDQRGYIWIATDNGVSRFDGYQFRNFGARAGLINNVVFHLQEDERGRIWMQTMSGKMYYHWQDSIYPYAHNEIFERYQPYLPQGFILSENSWSYFALSDLGLLRIGPDGQHEVINAKYANSIMLLEKPELSSTLFSIASNKTIEKFGLKHKATNRQLIMAVFADSLEREYEIPVKTGTTRSSGFSDKTHQLFDLRQELLVFYRHQFQSRHPLPAKAAVLTKKDSTFWVGLNDKLGIWAFRGFSDLQANRPKPYLDGNSISALCKDRLGGYWFGTLENGIFYAPNLHMEVIQHPGASATEQILSLEQWPDGQILMGTDEGRLYALDTMGTIRPILPGVSPVFDLYYIQKEEETWVTGRPFRVLQHGAVRALNYAPDLGIRNMVSGKKLQLSRDSSRLFSLTSIGLEIIDIDRKEVIYSTIKTSYQERFLNAFEDAQGRIWIGSVRGLLQFKDRQFLRPPLRHPVFDIRIEAIEQLADSTLILGSKGSGVALWKDTTVTIIDENDGLTSNMIENMMVDEHQQIWVGTLNGLNVLSRQEDDSWRVRRITMAHGLPSNEIHDLCPQNGSMYVATSRGMVKLALKDKASAERSRPLLENILVNGRPAAREQLNRLTHSQRNIQLQFVCLNFKFQKNLPYRYRLTSEPGWSYTLDRSVNYAALAPGTYLFEVQAQNEDGVWSESLCLPISIAPPIWQRWWSISLIAIALVSLIYYWYRSRLARMKKEADIEREINELQRSALQAQMNPHFIFNCLNSIQSFIASGNKASAMGYLSRFANLVRTTLNASSEKVITLQEEVEVLENYLELEKLRFGNRFEYEIVLDHRLDLFDTTLPPLLVQPYVENAIIHGFNFKDKSRKGHILLAYALVDDLLQISIRDNGIGIEQSRQNKVGKEKLRTSRGMQITQKRLSLQNPGKDGGYLRIKELVNEEGEIAGTEIIIRITF